MIRLGQASGLSEILFSFLQLPRAPAWTSQYQSIKVIEKKGIVWIVIARASSLFLLHDWVCFYRKNLCCYESLWLKSRILLSDAFCLKRWCCSWYLSSLRKKKNKLKNHQTAHSSQETLETSLVLLFFFILKNQAMLSECIADASLGPAWFI